MSLEGLNFQIWVKGKWLTATLVTDPSKICGASWTASLLYHGAMTPHQGLMLSPEYGDPDQPDSQREHTCA